MADGRKTVKVKTLSPEDVVCLQLTGRPSVEAVVQTQLTEVPEVQVLQLLHTVLHTQLTEVPEVQVPQLLHTDCGPFLGGQVLGLDDPGRQDVLQPPAVVLVGVNSSSQVLHPLVSLCCRATGETLGARRSRYLRDRWTEVIATETQGSVCGCHSVCVCGCDLEAVVLSQQGRVHWFDDH